MKRSTLIVSLIVNYIIIGKKSANKKSHFFLNLNYLGTEVKYGGLNSKNFES